MSQPPDYPGIPADPHGNQNPSGYPPPGSEPPAGYGTPPAPQFDVGDAFSWSWKQFTSNATALVVPTAVYGAIIAGLIALTVFLPIFLGRPSSTTFTDSNGQIFGSTTTVTLGPASIAAMVVGYILLLVAAVVMTTALVSGCLDIADGKPVTIGSFFKPRRLGAALLVALLIALGTWIGLFLFVIPGIVFAFLATFAIPFVVDRSLTPFESLKASFVTVRSNVGNTLLSWLVQMAAVLVGELLCVIGLVAGIPVAQLVLTYTYRKLSGGQVVPVPRPGYPPNPQPHTTS